MTDEERRVAYEHIRSCTDTSCRRCPVIEIFDEEAALERMWARS